jgi:hypothetical protein
MAQLGRAALLSTQLDGATARLTFRDSVAAELEVIVAAERSCCAFLEFELARRNGFIDLSIAGRPGASEFVAELAGAFAPTGGSVATGTTA